jgi:hypothetical protein
VNKLLLKKEEKQNIFPLRSHIRLVFLDAFNQLVPSKSCSRGEQLNARSSISVTVKKEVGDHLDTHMHKKERKHTFLKIDHNVAYCLTI